MKNMKQNILLSVIIPVYNVENYLKECLDSILLNNSNLIEVLLIDDGSTDTSGEICDSYSQQYVNFHTYHVENSGPSTARNLGIQHAVGKWFWFIDSDDVIREGSISSILSQLQNSESDILIFQYYKFTSDDHILLKLKDVAYHSITKSKAMLTLLNDNYSTYIYNKIFKKDLFKKISFPIKRKYEEDMAINYKLYDEATSFKISKAKMYGYRDRENSLTSDKSLKSIRDSALSRYEMYSFLKEKYSINIEKLRFETEIDIISYLHRVDKTDKLWKQFSSFLSHTPLKHHNFRYKVEIFSFKYCKPIFYLIGFTGKQLRKIKKGRKIE